jgi:arabinogalactan endo-1,4-beta-galactosidase
MYSIKGFSTKKDIKQQLKNAGVTSIRVPFNADPEFRYTKEVDFELRDIDGKKVKKLKKEKDKLLEGLELSKYKNKIK